MGNKLIKHVESEEGWLVLFYCVEFMNRLKRGKKRLKTSTGEWWKCMRHFLCKMLQKCIHFFCNYIEPNFLQSKGSSIDSRNG